MMNKKLSRIICERNSPKGWRFTQHKLCLISILLTAFQISVKSNSPYFVSDTTELGDTIRKTIPYSLPWDDMPIDLSFVYE